MIIVQPDVGIALTTESTTAAVNAAVAPITSGLEDQYSVKHCIVG